MEWEVFREVSYGVENPSTGWNTTGNPRGIGPRCVGEVCGVAERGARHGTPERNTQHECERAKCNERVRMQATDERATCTLKRAADARFLSQMCRYDTESCPVHVVHKA